MVTRSQDLGNPEIIIIRRPCILGILEQRGSCSALVGSGGSRKLSSSQGLARDDARHEAVDRVDEDQGRDLARREHVIADRDFVGDITVYHPLIYAFVTAADDDEFFLAGKIRGHRLVKSLPEGVT